MVEFEGLREELDKLDEVISELGPATPTLPSVDIWWNKDHWELWPDEYPLDSEASPDITDQ